MSLALFGACVDLSPHKIEIPETAKKFTTALSVALLMLENLRHPDHTWKVRLIEEEFNTLMFDVQDV